MKSFAALALSLAIALPATGALAHPQPPQPPHPPAPQAQKVQAPSHQPAPVVKKAPPHMQPQPQHQAQHQQGPKGPSKAQPPRPPAPPAIGSRVGRDAKPFQRSAKSRFKAPPRGHDYRVVNDHIVEIDAKTLKVVAVLGLLSALNK